MDRWLRAKLDALVSEFNSGSGSGWVFETQYLAYLECYAAARIGHAHTFWADYQEFRKKHTPEGHPPQQLARSYPERADLMKALQKFRLKYEMPTRTPFVAPDPKKPDVSKAQNRSPVRSEGEGKGPSLSLFDILEEEP